MEKPVSNEGLSSGNYDPVYNTLEDPLYLGFGCGGQNGPTGMQDPVYNVLEGPGADVVKCKVSKHDTIAVYAVANTKKKWETPEECQIER